jgi:hypothetical protein
LVYLEAHHRDHDPVVRFFQDHDLLRRDARRPGLEGDLHPCHRILLRPEIGLNTLDWILTKLFAISVIAIIVIVVALVAYFVFHVNIFGRRMSRRKEPAIY